MMGNTYAAVIEQSEKEFVKQWAKIVVSLERAVPKEDAKGYLEAYSIPLGPSDDPRYEQVSSPMVKIFTEVIVLCGGFREASW